MSPIGMTARLLTQVCCFLYPAYRGYKIIEADSSDPEAVRTAYGLVTYWAVVGVWLSIESIIGWTFTWIPFYYVFRFLALFYLSLPQTEAAEWVYDNYLAPAFRDHERDIDVFVAGMRGKVMTGLSSGLSWLWDKIRSQITGQTPQAGAAGYDLHHQYPTGIAQPPTLQDPASGPAQQLFGMFTRYAGQYTPVVVAALSSAATAARTAATNNNSGNPSVASQVPETVSMPIPRPKVESSNTDNSLRSRTYRHAQGSEATTPTGTSSARARQVFTPSISQRGSEESVNSAASAGSQRGDSGYDQIGRDEVVDYPKGDPMRPPVGRRRSSWFSGWGSPDRQKSE